MSDARGVQLSIRVEAATSMKQHRVGSLKFACLSGSSGLRLALLLGRHTAGGRTSSFDSFERSSFFRSFSRRWKRASTSAT